MQFFEPTGYQYIMKNWIMHYRSVVTGIGDNRWRLGLDILCFVFRSPGRMLRHLLERTGSTTWKLRPRIVTTWMRLSWSWCKLSGIFLFFAYILVYFSFTLNSSLLFSHIAFFICICIILTLCFIVKTWEIFWSTFWFLIWLQSRIQTKNKLCVVLFQKYFLRYKWEYKMNGDPKSPFWVTDHLSGKSLY